MVDRIDIHSLQLDELAGVVHLYPWYAAARKELCRRMGDRWGVAQLSGQALYLPDRSKLSALVRNGRREDYSDAEVSDLLARLLEPALPASEEPAAGEGAPSPHVVGGDYFSQSQYAQVSRSDDNIFTRFAAKARTEGTKEDRTGADIADHFATETLASIFADQGRFEEARRIYSRLILDNPEKSAYFASLIDKLN